MVVKIRILTPEYGDRVMTMNATQFQDLMQKNKQKGWTIFSQDNNVPIEEQSATSGSVKIQDIKDGQSYTVVPQLQGG